MNDSFPPLIGLTSYAEPARWAVWEGKAAVVGWVYVDAIHRAGGRTLIIPPADHGQERILDVLDGLVLAGGQDIDPGRYGAERDRSTEAPQHGRDGAELALTAAAMDRGIPVLGICRGIQVMNVARGGDIIQHLPDAIGITGHREVVGVFSEHDVAVEPGSRLQSILGDVAPVLSHHHQAAGAVGDGLRPVAWSDDGTIEALESTGDGFAVGVQWHPEEGEDLALFTALVDAARRYRESLAGK